MGELLLKIGSLPLFFACKCDAPCAREALPKHPNSRKTQACDCHESIVEHSSLPDIVDHNYCHNDLLPNHKKMVRRTKLPANLTAPAPAINGAAKAKTVEAQSNMIGRPTINVSERADTRVIQSVQTDPYFAIKVSTVGATEPEQVVLFDGSQGYQLGYNQFIGPNVQIEGLSANYQFILNDMVHNSSYLDMLKMRVNDNSSDANCCSGTALDQYARPVEIYDASKGSKPRLLKTIYPDQGVHEGQYQLNINTFANDLIITNRTAFVYLQEPGITITWGFYQVAELGRKQ